MEYGILGLALPHTFSPYLHSLFGNNDYGVFEISESLLDDFFTRRSFKGINVTVPYKQAVMRYCDTISDIAKRIGAVNCIRNKNGILQADNTDYYGFKCLCNSINLDLKGKNILILGSGGTSHTVKTVCADEHASSITIISRNGKDNYENIYLHKKTTDIIINTTPVGMFPHIEDAPVELNGFKNLCAVIDVIYNPLRTRLTSEAKALGIPNTNGLYMLVYQAKAAHEFFFDTVLDNSTAKNVFLKLQNEKQNLVLVGMPGSGKTTAGKKTAELLERPFFDTDKMVEQKIGLSIPEIFNKYGEQFFREKEREVIELAGKQNGVVIATGGGAVMDPRNRFTLHQNGKVVWLNKQLDKLATSGRPLSSDIEKLKQMQAIRTPLYHSVSDIKIDVKNDCEATAKEIISMFFCETKIS